MDKLGMRLDLKTILSKNTERFGFGNADNHISLIEGKWNDLMDCKKSYLKEGIFLIYKNPMGPNIEYCAMAWASMSRHGNLSVIRD